MQRLRPALAASQAYSTAAASTVLPFSHALVTSPAAQRAVGAWLFGGAAWVFSMVVLGGVTRLTRSGLSMTDWKFTGEAAPRTPEEWDAEFAKYQQSPEFQKVNRHMTVEEFKFIFLMEYAHRMWGRVLTIPNILSVIRLILVPVFLYLLLARHAYGPAVAILIFGGVSDWADGKIARLVANQSSRLGELLDPLVDRIYMVAVPVGLALAGVLGWPVVGILLAALYTPVWTSAILVPADFALALVCFGMLAVWRVTPWSVVIVAAGGGALFSM